jgi:hypothetical protein
MSTLFEGKVANYGWVRAPSRDYFLIHVRGKEKPLALDWQPPEVKHGARVSVEVNEGDRWFFAVHRSISVTKQPVPVWKPKPEKPNFLETLSQPILDWLDSNPTVNADDVFAAITNLAMNRDPRIVGRAFQYLARKNRIHSIGFTRTRRPGTKAATIAVWELTK